MPGNVTGRVSNRAGVPVADATIVVSGVGPFPDIAPVSDERGRFMLHGLAPGEYELRAIGGGERSGIANVHIAEGKTASVEIVID